MAISRRYTVQLAFVGTPAQYEALAAEAESKRVSVAAVIRAAVNYRYGLSDGERPVGDRQQIRA